MIHLKSNGVDYAKSINILGSRIYLIAPIAPVLSEKKTIFAASKNQSGHQKSSNLTARGGGEECRFGYGPAF